MDKVEKVDRTDKVRKGLKAADDDLDFMLNDDFFDRLHDKIMNEVEQVEIQPAPMLMSPRNLLRSHWRGWLYPLGGVAAVFMLVSLLLPQLAKVNQTMTRAGLLSDGQERIATEALLSPDEIAQTFIITQNESDFFMDVAQESFENLSVDKFNQIMGEGGR